MKIHDDGEIPYPDTAVLECVCGSDRFKVDWPHDQELPSTFRLLEVKRPPGPSSPRNTLYAIARAIEVRARTDFEEGDYVYLEDELRIVCAGCGS